MMPVCLFDVPDGAVHITHTSGYVPALCYDRVLQCMRPMTIDEFFEAYIATGCAAQDYDMLVASSHKDFDANYPTLGAAA